MAAVATAMVVETAKMTDPASHTATPGGVTGTGIHRLPAPVMDHQPMLWRVDHRLLREAVDIDATLSDDERLRSRYIRDKHQARTFAASRAALRLILGELLGKRPRELKFKTNRYGKLHLSPPDNDLGFNLSHASAYTLIAAAWGRAVGVDIEMRDDDLDPLEIGSVVLTHREMLKLQSLNNASRYRFFYQLWTAKEATLKMLGAGFSLHPQQIDVLEALQHERQTAIPPQARELTDKTRFELAHLSVARGYAAAVAIA